MNILILTGRFGMGHYSAAEAVGQEILASEPNANINTVDIINYLFPSINRFIYGWFRFLVGKCSFVYNYLHRIAGNSSSVPLKSAALKKMVAFSMPMKRISSFQLYRYAPNIFLLIKR